MSARFVLSISVYVCIAAWAQAATPLGTGFTYQGQLKQNSSPLNGTVNLSFSLWDSAGSGSPPTGGAQLGAVQTLNNVAVANGEFMVTLNGGAEFGVSALNGDSRWLQIAVNGMMLSPRQSLTAVPYATFSQNLRGVTVDATGKVGVGTTTPASKLHVAAPGDPELSVESTDPQGHRWAIQSTGGSILPLASTFQIIDRTQNALRFAIQPSGAVGIGTGTPSEKLTVTGRIESTSGGVKFPDGTIQTTASTGGNGFWWSSGVNIYNNNNGNVGIGTSTPRAPLSLGTSLGDKIALFDNPGDTYGFGIQGGLLQIFAGGPGGDVAFGTGPSGSFSEVMRIKGNGNVGIGTNGPATKLDVAGGVRVSGKSTTHSQGAHLEWNRSSSNGETWLLNQKGLGSGGIVFGEVDTLNATIERMRIDANGNVGIGTSNPTNLLSVNGNSNITGNVTLGVSPANQFTVYGNANFNGKVGIGVAPTQALSVGGMIESTSGFKFPDGTTQTTAANQWVGSLGNMYSSGSGNVGIGTNQPLNKLSVFGNCEFEGKVGIGTAAPAEKLSVAGNIQCLGAGIIFANGTMQSTASNAWSSNADFSYVWTQPVVGVGIGTTTPVQKLHVVGNICATGTIGACSDARFKTNVKPIDKALETVEKLRPVRFDWKREQFPEQQFSKDPQIGLIAQEVQKVAPEVVQIGSNGDLSVDYGRLAPLLIGAVKQQQAQMKSLEAENAELKARLERLEAMMVSPAREKNTIGR